MPTRLVHKSTSRQVNRGSHATWRRIECGQLDAEIDRMQCSPITFVQKIRHCGIFKLMISFMQLSFLALCYSSLHAAVPVAWA